MPSRSTDAGIVVGVDDSPSSTLAVRWAAREAVMRNVPLTVVHVSSPLAVSPPVPEAIAAWNDLTREKLQSGVS